MKQPSFPTKQLFVLGESFPSGRIDSRKKAVEESVALSLDVPTKLRRLGWAVADKDGMWTALCRICEPIAFMSIFPYVYYMVRSFDVTTNTKQLALYVGLVTSSFAFAEFSSGVVWGRISDRIGRKPVLLCGLAGTALSMLVFGFAPNLPVALLGRALGGLLNG